MSNEELAATVALNADALAALLEQVKQIQQAQSAAESDEFVPEPLALSEEVVPEAPTELTDSAEHRR
jgi:hypothetical protein